MQNFNFYNPTRIYFGKDRLSELPKVIPAGSNILVVFGSGSVERFGTLQKVRDSLQSFRIHEFGGVEANPHYTTLMKAVEISKENKIDFLLAVGGGSVIDGTKFIALASNCTTEESLRLLYKGYGGMPIAKAVPFGTILTLPATGSEMNAGAVISHGSSKYVVMSPITYPQFSFLDPSLTFTLPETQVANGLADAFVHVSEQYVTYPAQAMFQDSTAEGILRNLISIGRKCIDHPTDYDLRANLVWNATMALNGIIGAGVPQDWSTHMIGHELTAHFGIDHGKSLAIIMPSVWELKKDKKRIKLLQYGRNVWNIHDQNEDHTIDLAIAKTREFFESLDISTRLTSYGVKRDDFKKITEGLKSKGMLALSENQDIDPAFVLRILENAL